MKFKLLLLTQLLFSIFSLPTWADTEPDNNVYTGADVMAENGSVSGSIYMNPVGDTDDWYQFTTTIDGNITLTFTCTPTSYNRIYLYDSNGVTSFGSAEGTGGASFTKTGLAAGTYYARYYYFNSGQASEYTLTNSVSAQIVSNDAEPNNEYTQALAMDENATVYGHIGYRNNGGSFDTDDWYVFSTTNDGAISLALSNTMGAYNRIYLYDSDGTTNLGSNEGTGGATFTRDGLAAGTYYARVYYFNSNEFSQYTLTQSLAAAEYPTDLEINDTYVLALPMAENDSVAGHIGYRRNGGTYDESDWYYFTTTSDGSISLNISNNTGQFNRIYLYDSDGTTNLGSSEGTGTATFTKAGLAAGNYYARVYYFNSNEFSGYKLKNTVIPAEYDQDTEPNNVPADAITMNENSTVEGHIGHRLNGGTFDESDWYYFTTTSDGSISLTIANNTGQYNRVYLYDSNGTTNLGSAEGTGGATFTENGLAAGNYYARVYYFNSNEYSGYTLTNTVIPTEYANDEEPNDDFDSANDILTNSTVYGHIGHRYNGGSYDQSDYYKFTTHSAGDLTVTLSNNTSQYNRIYLYNANESQLESQEGTGGASFTESNIAAGTYYLRVYYFNSNEYSGYSLTNNFCPDQITIEAQGETTLCEGESVTLSTPDHHLSYVWSAGSTTETIVATLEGEYSLTIDNGNGCVRSSNTVDIEVTPNPVATIQADGPTTFCDGGSVNLSVPVGPDSYLWSTGETTPTINVTETGDYSVTLYKGDCFAISSPVHVTVNAIPSAAISPAGPVVKCNGGTVTLNAVGGYDSYLWSNGETTSSVTVDVSGNYSVTVTDNGCSTSSAAVSVTISAPIEISQTVTDVVCNGDENGSINATVTGGTPTLTYSWSNGATSEDISGVGAGTYTLLVTDGAGCTKSKNINVEEPDVLDASETHVNESTPGAADGSIDVTVSGGTFPYSYAWNDGPTSQDRSGLSEGTYNVTITDDNGCQTSLSVTIVATGCDCVVPTGITVNDITSSKATLVWDDNDCATGYSVHRRRVGETDWGTYTVFDGSTTSKLFKNMSPNTEFEVQVQSLCAGSDSSGYSESVFFTTNDLCHRPKGLESSDVTSTTADISWNYSIEPIDWIIHYYPDNGPTYKKYVDGSNTSAHLTDLIPNTLYYWYMKGKCENEKSNKTATQSFKTLAEKLSGSADENVTLYPNPASSLVNVSFNNPAEGKVTIQVLDVNARVVYISQTVETAGNIHKELDLTSLEAGVYQLQVIKTDGMVTNQSFVKVKE